MKRAAILVLALAAACGRAPAPSVADSGVEGRVLIGPTCPVERVDSPCPDQPFKATLRFDDAQGHEVKRVTTGSDGRFKVALEPGAYVVTPVLTSTPPSGAPQEFTVRAHQYTTITVSVDSGIR